jgi:EAL and modified HD-GYP domain-containing signal transduction protein
MGRVLVSRQPIFNAAMREFGYELLYRSDSEDHAEFSDGDRATAEVILNTFEIGLEELVGKHLAFINFDRDLIVTPYCESLPKDKAVLELVSSVELDEELLVRLDDLNAKGYRIAVTTHSISKRDYPLLELVHFVRLDVTSRDWTAVERLVGGVRQFPLQLIAERVETIEQFEHCKNLGFDYFQGYFFCKPQLVEGKQIPVNRLSTLRMLATLNDPQTNIREVENAIIRDVRLSYKLLRYANSAMCGLQRPVDSIRHAIVLVGLEKIRIWASLLLLYGFDDKASDIMVTGAMRARMCEQLAKAQGISNSNSLFLVGLLSVLDALIGQPMGRALAALPLTAAVSDAILYEKGELGEVLKCVLAYERRDWVQALSGVNLPKEVIRQAYVDAVGWSLRTLGELSAETDGKPAKGTQNDLRVG